MNAEYIIEQYCENYYDSNIVNFFLEEYENWKKSLKETKTKNSDSGSNNKEQIAFKFKFGDISSKQGYNNYSKYIQDGACQFVKSTKNDEPDSNYFTNLLEKLKLKGTIK